MEEMIIQTKEYGKLKGKILSMEELDRCAKERELYIKFLGIYEHENIAYMAFYNQKTCLFVSVSR